MDQVGDEALTSLGTHSVALGCLGKLVGSHKEAAAFVPCFRDGPVAGPRNLRFSIAGTSVGKVGAGMAAAAVFNCVGGGAMGEMGSLSSKAYFALAAWALVARVWGPGAGPLLS